MSIVTRIKAYFGKREIKHCTFNPDGPGVVRIHLLPPKKSLVGSRTHVVILNGYYILPIGESWAALLSAFIDEVNPYHGREISDGEGAAIYASTVKRVKRLYPSVSDVEITEDLDRILETLFTVARGEAPDEYIERMSIREYSKSMVAPHRMDLLISAMVDAEGCWKCNQKCTFCYAAGQNKASVPELSTKDWEKIIDKLWDAGVPMVTFTGGEPTMREDLTELVTYAKRFVTRVNTNGILLTPELATRLREAGLDSVQVTLYSHDAEIHNLLVGAEHFSDTVTGIKAAVSAGLDVSVNTPLCGANADYVKTLEFIYSLGVRFVTVSGLIATGKLEGRADRYDLARCELEEILRAAKAYCDGVGMEIDFTSPGLVGREVLESLGMKVPACGACLSNMAIAPNGDAVPCQSWLGEDATLGNLLTDDFKDIWSSPLCHKLRSMTEDEAEGCPLRRRGGSGNG